MLSRQPYPSCTRGQEPGFKTPLSHFIPRKLGQVASLLGAPSFSPIKKGYNSYPRRLLGAWKEIQRFEQGLAQSEASTLRTTIVFPSLASQLGFGPLMSFPSSTPALWPLFTHSDLLQLLECIKISEFRPQETRCSGKTLDFRF